MIRKIESAEEAAKKKKRNQILIGGILILVMVLSTAGFSFIQNKDTNSNGATTQNYNGFVFSRNPQGLWDVQINGHQFIFNYLPRDVQNISITGNFSLQSYADKPLYVVNNSYAFQEIYANIGSYVLRAQPACFTGENCTDYPEKSCDDNLIIFNQSSVDSVKQYRGCVYISGDFGRGADLFLYKVLGIVN